MFVGRKFITRGILWWSAVIYFLPQSVFHIYLYIYTIFWLSVTLFPRRILRASKISDNTAKVKYAEFVCCLRAQFNINIWKGHRQLFNLVKIVFSIIGKSKWKCLFSLFCLHWFKATKYQAKKNRNVKHLQSLPPFLRSPGAAYELRRLTTSLVFHRGNRAESSASQECELFSPLHFLCRPDWGRSTQKIPAHSESPADTPGPGTDKLRIKEVRINSTTQF